MPDCKLKKVWREMNNRCSTITHKNYKDYGERGIFVDQLWVDSYAEFESWSNLNGYTEGLQLDRENNDGPYCSGNCKWATYEEQSVNKRRYKNNTSGYKGVSFNNKLQKFGSYIQVNKKRKYLGTFTTAIAAAEARDTFILATNMAKTLLSKEANET